MSKHDPGPWTVCKKSGIRIYDKAGRHIESVSEHNAPLIAAAPDMLVLLKHVCNKHMNSRYTCQTSCPFWGMNGLEPCKTIAIIESMEGDV